MVEDELEEGDSEADDDMVEVKVDDLVSVIVTGGVGVDDKLAVRDLLIEKEGLEVDDSDIDGVADRELVDDGVSGGVIVDERVSDPEIDSETVKVSEREGELVQDFVDDKEFVADSDVEGVSGGVIVGDGDALLECVILKLCEDDTELLLDAVKVTLMDADGVAGGVMVSVLLTLAVLLSEVEGVKLSEALPLAVRVRVAVGDGVSGGVMVAVRLALTVGLAVPVRLAEPEEVRDAVVVGVSGGVIVADTDAEVEGDLLSVAVIVELAL